MRDRATSPPTVAVIVVVPGACATTPPLGVTEAISGWSLIHLSDAPTRALPLLSLMVAVSCRVSLSASAVSESGAIPIHTAPMSPTVRCAASSPITPYARANDNTETRAASVDTVFANDEVAFVTTWPLTGSLLRGALSLIPRGLDERGYGHEKRGRRGCRGSRGERGELQAELSLTSSASSSPRNRPLLHDRSGPDLLVTQRLDGVEPRGAHRRKDPEENPGRGAPGHRNRHPLGRHRRFDGGVGSDEPRDDRTHGEAHHRTDAGERNGFDQKLPHDREARGSESLSDPDLAGALGNADHHDRDHAYTAHDQTDR